MTYVTGSLPSLINGISQQPPSVRRPTQGEEQVNCVSSVVFGLQKRPPTRHIGKISSNDWDEVYTNVINRDADEKYILALRADGVDPIGLYDTEGTAQTITSPNGTGYLNKTSYLTGTRAVTSGYASATIADTTFICNKDTVVAKDATIYNAARYEALCYIKQGRPATTYSIYIGGVIKATYTTPEAGSTTTVVGSVSTTTNTDTPSSDDIAAELVTQLLISIPAFTVTRRGSVIDMERSLGAGGDFTFRVEDSYGNQASIGIKGKTSSISDLPLLAKNNFTVEITGDESNSFDNYYVHFISDAGSDGTGSWVETIKPGIATKWDNSTMPYSLAKVSAGNFTFNRIDYDTRNIGDDSSAPYPSFTGATINDVFTYRNRFGFLSDENIILSEAGEFYNFFPTTATTVLDSDRIDVSGNSSKVSILKHAVPFNKQLLLYSDQTQFIVDTGSILTPKTMKLDPSTVFAMDTKVRPVDVGSYVYFTSENVDVTKVREYYVQENTVTEDAADITSATPTYIPKNVFKIAGSSSRDILIFLSTDTPNLAYVNEFFWSGTDKLQSAWHKWEFPSTDTLLSVEIIDSEAYFFIKRTDGIYLEKMNLQVGAKDTGLTFQVALDRRQELTGSYNSGTNTTTWTSTVPLTEDFKAVKSGAWGTEGGLQITVSNPTSTTLTATGDFSDESVFIGLFYTSTYTLSELFVRQAAKDGNGLSAVTNGVLQLKRGTVVFDDTGYFRMEVTPAYRDTFLYPFNGFILGSGTAIIGQVNISSGRFNFGIGSKSTQVDIQLINDTYLPFSILSLDWEGDYILKATRV